jgi:carboxypeptidase D
MDFILLGNGTLMTIQNMTWGGKQGFQKKPKADLYVPYHRELNQGTIAASGVMGVTHTERGLTWNEVFLSGHMVPQYQPSVAYRQMEFLLGRIESLTEITPFTTQPDVNQLTGVLRSNVTVSSNATGLIGGAMPTHALFGRLKGGA